MGYLTQDRQLLTRLADRLRSMSDTALTRPRANLEGRSVAETVHGLCVWAAAEMEVPEPVPVLHPLASGDQLEVVGREFLGWVAGQPEPTVAEGPLGLWREAVSGLRRAV